MVLAKFTDNDRGYTFVRAIEVKREIKEQKEPEDEEVEEEAL